MFVLAQIKESIRLHPARLRYDLFDAVTNALSQKYCNKVVVNLGLCISIFDISQIDDPYVHQGEAFASVKVIFRVVVLRPFVGEIIVGKIRHCSEEGVHVSIGFFDDILIPVSCLQTNSHFDSAEQVWIWDYQDNKMYMDKGETIRFRVLQEQFVETAPAQKEMLMARLATMSNLNTVDAQANIPEESIIPTISPYKILGSIAEDGLGLTSWWGA